jgi:hypothetical protein
MPSHPGAQAFAKHFTHKKAHPVSRRVGSSISEALMTITPYNISTFGKTHTEYENMKALIANPQATVEEMRSQWANLCPLLGKLLCQVSEDSIQAPDFISENYTGMPSAQALGLPIETAATWERMRVLQGLFMHMQMWVFFNAHHIVTSPTPYTADYYNDTLAELITQFADLLYDCEAMPDEIENWARAIIEACRIESATKATNDAQRYRHLRKSMSFSQIIEQGTKMSLSRPLDASSTHDFDCDWMQGRFDQSVDRTVDADMQRSPTD